MKQKVLGTPFGDLDCAGGCGVLRFAQNDRAFELPRRKIAYFQRSPRFIT